ncbi:MAG: UvrB/UvrC motif-containing protein [Oscillospiraceae bacterium]|nr:UvrB/UvrC motif-containing protein [Oscillospiraceae bacterium]
MKCEHCGRAEATFHYHTSINGAVQQAHLCEGCARELGYQTDITMDFGGFSDLFSMVSGDFFAPRTFAPARFTPAGQRMLQVLPREEEHEAPLLNEEEQRALRRQRECNALQLAINEALDAEDYEKAASLRDELRRLESGGEE